MVSSEFNGLTYTTSHQHQEIAALSNLKCDYCGKIKGKLVACTQFSPDPFLRTIVTGVIGEEVVNVHNLQIIKKYSVGNMVVNPIFGESFKPKDRAKTVSRKTKDF